MANIPVSTDGSLDMQDAEVGDYYENSGEEHLFVENTSGTDKDVTITAQTQPRDPALTCPDRTLEVGDGTTVGLDPAVHPDWFNRADGTVAITYPDGVTGLRVAVVRFQGARKF